MRYLYLFLFIFITAALLLFTIQNIQSVPVFFLNLNYSMPLSLLFILLYILGMFSGTYLFSLLRTLYRKSIQTDSDTTRPPTP